MSAAAPFIGSRLRGQIRFAGVEIDGNGDVLVDDHPVASDFAIDVGHPHGEIDRLALGVGAADPLNAVAIPKSSIGRNAEVADLELERSFDMGEEVLPVLV